MTENLKEAESEFEEEDTSVEMVIQLCTSDEDNHVDMIRDEKCLLYYVDLLPSLTLFVAIEVQVYLHPKHVRWRIDVLEAYVKRKESLCCLSFFVSNLYNLVCVRLVFEVVIRGQILLKRGE